MGVFVNRILNLKNVKVIGFDMDHTLVRYHSEVFEEMAFHEVIKKLVAFKNYPSEILNFKFDYAKVIRGLVFDIVRGNLLKLSLYGEVKMGLHGLSPMSFDAMRKTYKGYHIDPSQPEYYSIDTTFSISKGLLFSMLVDLKDLSIENEFFKNHSYVDIFNDIEEMLNLSHSDESLKGEVRKHITKYVIRDKDSVEMLQGFKKEGKILALITNSDYDYTKLLLDYTINPFMPSSEDWSHLFDYVITLSDKPRFFTEGSRFLKVNRDTGLMKNWLTSLERGIYQGGCAREFQKQLDLKGDQILYLGDHIYGDIVTLKKSCDWKTGLVVEELTQEIASLKTAEPIQKEIDRFMEEKVTLEKQLTGVHDEEEKKIYLQIRKLDEEITQNLLKYQDFFNPIWGPVMRSGQEESRLASQIERYAGIYMAKISDLKEYSPRHYFRPNRRPLPHELVSK
jgi:HAD superfamily 5'-nucleotidase-like hydrolase